MRDALGPDGPSVAQQRNYLSSRADRNVFLRYRDRFRDARADAHDEIRKANLLRETGDQEGWEAASSAAQEKLATLDDLSWMGQVHSVSGFRQTIKTREYWLDDWGLEHLQLHFRVKFVIVGAGGGVQMEVAPDGLATFRPDYFIVVDLAGKHYRLRRRGDGKAAFTPAEAEAAGIFSMLPRRGAIFAS